MSSYITNLFFSFLSLLSYLALFLPIVSPFLSLYLSWFLYDTKFFFSYILPNPYFNTLNPYTNGYLYQEKNNSAILFQQISLCKMDYFAPSKYRIRANKPPPLPRSLSFFAHFLFSELKPSRVADLGGIDQEPEPTLEKYP